MAKLSTTLSLVDGFSSKLNAINSSLKETGSAMTGFKSKVSEATSQMGNMSSGMAAKIGVISGVAQSVTSSVLSSVSGMAAGMIGDLSSASATWQTFQGNMNMIGKTPDQIKAVKAELQDFAIKTIYSASDMASTYSQLEAVGIKSADKLTMGFGGLAAAAENPQQAMKTLSQQATQMAAKPMVQWQDFKLMLEQTPAGIAQIAKTMNMSTAELVKNVQDGKIKTQDFFDAVTTTGTNDKFTKMATQFKTVGQAMDGFKESLTNKLQPTFDKLSQKVISALEKISDYVNTINFDKIGNKFISFIDSTINSVKQFWAAFKDSGAISAVSSAFSAIGSAINHVVSVLSSGGNGVKSFGDALGGITKSVANTIESIANAISKMSPSQINGVVGALKAAAVAMIGFNVASAAFKKGLSVYQGITGTISTIKNLASALKGLPATPSIPTPAANMPEAPSGGGATAGWVNAAKTATTLLAVAVSIKIVASAFKEVASVNVSWEQLGQNLAQMGTFLAAGAGSMALIGAAVNKFSALQSSLATGAVALIAIAGTLAIVGKALEVVTNVKLGTVQTALSQLAVMGTMLGATAVAMGVVGGAIMLFPPLAAALAIGAVVFIGLAGSMAIIGAGLLVFAKEVQAIVSTINSIKVESNISDKLAQIEKIITSLSIVGGMASVVGALAAPFAILGAISFGVIISSISKVVNFATQLSGMKIPSSESIKPKFKQIQDFVKDLTSIKLGKVGDIGAVFSSAFANLTTGNIIGTFKKVSDFVQQVNSMPSIDSSILQSKFKMLADIKTALNNAAQGSSTGGNNIDASFNSFFGKLDTSNVVSSFQKITDFVKKLSAMDAIDSSGLDSKFTQIKNVLNKIRDFASEKFDNSFLDSLKSFFGKLDTSNLVSSFTKVADLTKKIATLPDLNDKALDAKFKSIKSVFDKLKNFKIEAPSDNLSTSMQAVEKIVNPLTQISKKFQSLNGVVVNSTNIIATMSAIKSVIDFLPKLNFTTPKGFDTSIANIVKPISSLTSVAKKLQEFSGLVVNSVNVIATMNAIKSIINGLSTTFIKPIQPGIETALKSINGPISSITSSAKKLQEMNGIVVNSVNVIATINAIKSIVNSFSSTFAAPIAGNIGSNVKAIIQPISSMMTVANKLQQLSGVVVNSTAVIATMNAIRSIVSNGAWSTISAGISKISGLQGSFATASTALSSLNNMVGNLNGIPAVTPTIAANVTAIQTALNSLSKLTVSGDISAQLQAIATSVNATLTAIRNFAAQTSSAGVQAGQGFANGLSAGFSQALGIAQSTASAISGSLSGISLYSAGAAIGQSLVSGLSSQMGSVVATAQALGAAIKANKGPIEYDRIMLVENGSVIVSGLINGLMSQKNKLIRSAQSLGDSIQSNATIGVSLQNVDIPRKELPKTGTPKKDKADTSKKVEINLGGITIQSYGDIDRDTDVMAEQVAQKIFKAVNNGLA